MMTKMGRMSLIRMSSIIFPFFGLSAGLFSISADVYSKGKKVKITQLNEWFATNREHKVKMHCTVGKDSKLGEMFVIYDDFGNRYTISDKNNDDIDQKIMDIKIKVMAMNKLSLLKDTKLPKGTDVKEE